MRFRTYRSGCLSLLGLGCASLSVRADITNDLSAMEKRYFPCEHVQHLFKTLNNDFFNVAYKFFFKQEQRVYSKADLCNCFMCRRIQSLDVRTHTLNIVIYLRGLEVRAVLPLRACI